MSAANSDLRAPLAEVDALISEHRMRLQELEDLRKPRAIQHQLARIVYLVCFSEGCKPVLLPSTAPLLLLQICKDWQSVAISTPRLWAHLHLNSDVYRCRPNRVEKLVEAWFNRTGPCPYFGSSEYSGMVPNPSNAIRATLLRYAPQLGSLALHLKSNHFQKLVGLGSFPLLQKLSILLLLWTTGMRRKFSATRFAETVIFGPRYNPINGSSASLRGSIDIRLRMSPPDDLLDILILELAPLLTDFKVFGPPRPHSAAYGGQNAQAPPNSHPHRLQFYSLSTPRAPPVCKIFTSTLEIIWTTFLLIPGLPQSPLGFPSMSALTGIELRLYDAARAFLSDSIVSRDQIGCEQRRRIPSALAIACTCIRGPS
ncbi:hypothetical protein FB451DRAFT_1410395 [Mycena latifolia]|nr:hypothetical protein FB451DRAFT_1410395 [Mycena latifolia]